MKKILLFVLISYFSTVASADWRSDLTKALKDGGGYAEASDGKVLFAYRENDLFIPASTLKLATTFCALETLTPNFRFKTEFYLTSNNILAVKGFGDPSLTSEDLKIIAQGLGEKISKINGIIIDDSFFEKPIEIDGSSTTLNPYDAPNGAILVNFNTIAVSRDKHGNVIASEPQTPLTPLARRLAARLPAGEQRISLGDNGIQYTGELLQEFLKQQGIKFAGSITSERVPSDAKKIYVYESQKTLANVIQGLLKFSTNFSANQLLLYSGAQEFGEPASITKGARWLTECLKKRAGLVNFKVTEGSGLSRKNEISPKELVKLLKAYSKYRDLLRVEDQFQGKTGTLTGVNSYAGYFDTPNGMTVRFSILVNSTVPQDYKFKLAKLLYSGVLEGR